MSVGMSIHMRVVWFFLLQECNARHSLDFRCLCNHHYHVEFYLVDAKVE